VFMREEIIGLADELFELAEANADVSA
jgi:hypothetical protein